ncbi:MAG: hypothetical protein LQ339_007570 [Xanthoria mediterranea]|nr:MAG: hypothetical protein LQ339_007570 [Xanthoria mediterranea]
MAPLRNRYKYLPFFASPLEEHSEHNNGHASHAPHFPEDFESSPEKGQIKHETRPAHARELTFREREEASSIELFDDLFFVANLSSFTGTQTSTALQTIAVKSYVGFFALLWFNWLQVTLYDVRFGVDSVFERVCKALHLGVMIAFAVVGTQFDTSDTAKNFVNFQQFSCIMLVSKVILLVQYGYILFWVRGHSKVVAPLLIHIAVYATGAVICLGLIFSFNDHTHTLSYVAWYVIAIIEALVIFASSSRWRSASFMRTNLNERVGLLTLIILGEGVIVLTKSMVYVTKGQNYSPAVIGQIIASVLVIYFLYMLYFDQVDAKRFGTIRQQFWALAHFPFHVALVLLLEGTSRLVTWRNATEMINYLSGQLDAIYYSSPNTTIIASALGTFASDMYTDFGADASKYNVTTFLSTLATRAKATVKASASYKTGAPKDPFKDLKSVAHVYDLVYVYFFVAAGCTLLMMAALIAVSKRNKCLGDYVAVALRGTVGFVLACVVGVIGNYNPPYAVSV